MTTFGSRSAARSTQGVIWLERRRH